MRRFVSLLLLPLLLSGCGGPASIVGISADSSSSVSSAPADPMTGWKEYLSDPYWLTIKYPGDYVPSESGKLGKTPSATVLNADGHPTAFETITFAAPGKPSFALSVFRGVELGVSVSKLDYDPRCGTQTAEKIVLSRVYVRRDIRFLERRQMKDGKVDIDFCFLNRQRYVLSLHGWGLDPAEADELHTILDNAIGTITLYRMSPSRDRSRNRPPAVIKRPS